MSDNPDFPRHLGPSDSVTWRIEKDPILRSTICFLVIVDRPLDYEVLRRKLLDASHFFPRLRQVVVEVPFGISTPIWANDPHFDLAFHLRIYRAGGDRSREWLLTDAAAIAMQSFDRERPLWECVVVEDLADGESAVILKVHHTLTDGVGGVQLMARLFDFAREPAPSGEELPEVGDGETFTPSELMQQCGEYEARRRAEQAVELAGSIASSLKSPARSARKTMSNLASIRRMLAPVTEPLSPIMTKRSPRYRFDMLTIPIDDLKSAAKATGGKLNDAFLAGVTLTLQNYHERQGVSVGHLRVNMPINIRTDDAVGAGGNQWVPARFALPVSTPDLGERMQEMHNAVAVQRDEPALAFVEPAADLLDQLPTMVLVDVLGGMLKALDFVSTNVPGVPVPLYVAGSEIKTMIPYAPTGGAACAFALLSYKDQVSIGINCDPEAVEDHDLMLECAREAFAEVGAYAQSDS